VFDIEHRPSADVAALLRDLQADAVVWAAATGDPERVRAVDYDAAIRLFEACKATDTRIVFVSAMDIHAPKKTPAYYSEASRAASGVVWGLRGECESGIRGGDPRRRSEAEGELTPDMQAKYDAEQALHASRLKFTTLRGCNLTDEPGKGVRLGAEQLVRDGAEFDPESLESLAAATPTTSRTGLAQAILASLEDKGSLSRTWDVVDGDDTAGEEVARCARDGVDAWDKEWCQ
jgi:nucleoside-diphosphate-sugar epimerase